MTAHPQIPTCATCGSTDVRADAYAEYNQITGVWELSTVFDKGSACETCEGACRLAWKSAPTPKRIGYACETCERRDSLSWDSTSTWCEDSQTYQHTDGEGTYCSECGPVAAVELVLPHPSDWAEAETFEVVAMALEVVGFGESEWRREDKAGAWSAETITEDMIRAAYSVYWRGEDGLAVHIDDFDELVDAQAFVAGIAEGRPVYDLVGEGA